MSSRSLRARLDRLGITAVTTGVPECRYHGVHCQLGAYWPLDRAVVDSTGVQMDELLDLIAQGRRKAGLPVAPHPRELWAVNAHERVPEAEIAQRNRETAALIAEAKAKNAVMEAEIRGERP
ncbi:MULTISPECIES: hypothetical protein [Streptomyces]|uniref:Uncharacterized protein n=2 Tax=Streptomyces TaxID=1883 RepID=A0ABV9IQM1_9ACTN